MTSEAFADIAKDAIEAYCVAHPGEATMLGNHRYDDRLEDPSREAADRRRVELRRLLKRLACLTGLDPQSEVDRDVLRTEADRELLSLDELDEPSWDAVQHNPGRALHALIAQDFAPMPDRLISVAGRLRAVPDYLAAARQRLTHPAAAHLEVAIGQLSGTHALITGQIARLAELAGRAAELAEPIERAAAAVLDYQEWLRKRLPSAPTTFRLGERRYASKLAMVTSWQPADLLEQAYADLARVEAELTELVAAGQPGGAVSRVEIAAEFDRLEADAPTSPEVLPRCRAALAEATRFVEQHDLLTLQHDPVEVVEMPEVDRGVAVAYCERVGPLETAPVPTRFAVSPAPADWPAERVRSYYREYNNHALHHITLHEAMPGHAEQFSHSRRYRDDSGVRSVFDSRTFTEGWAVYSEALMVERGYRTEVSAEAGRALQILHLRLMLRRILITILDVSVNAGDLDQVRAAELLAQRGYVAADEAAARCRWLQLIPTQPPLYYVGLLEVRQLVADLRLAHPDWSDRRLHDTVLAFGSPPVRQLRTLLGLPPAS